MIYLFYELIKKNVSGISPFVKRYIVYGLEMTSIADDRMAVPTDSLKKHILVGNGFPPLYGY